MERKRQKGKKRKKKKRPVKEIIEKYKTAALCSLGYSEGAIQNDQAEKGRKGQGQPFVRWTSSCIEAMSNRRGNQMVGFSGLDWVSGMPAQVRDMT